MTRSVSILGEFCPPCRDQPYNHRRHHGVAESLRVVASTNQEEVPVTKPVNPPKRVRKRDAITQDKCDYAIAGICIANPRGPVYPCIILDDKRQLNVCLKCFEHLVATGQWEEAT